MKPLELEIAFWDIYRSVDPDRDLVPLNAEFEKQKFLSCSGDYNPQFRYREVEHPDALKQLEELLINVNVLPAALSHRYEILISNLSQWIINFSRKGSNFGEWLYSLYGTPAEADLKSAYHILDSNVRNTADETEAKDPVGFFKDKLLEFGFNGWSVESSKMPSKVRISSVEKTIYIDTSAEFTQCMLERLSIHEIETHIRRHENGRLQSYRVFQYGFPKYLETEEGLAIYSEERSGLLSATDLRKYCLRLIASDLVRKMDFIAVYKTLLTYTDPEEAYAITLRVKRGLKNTASGFGYTKDQVYFSGLLKMRRVAIDDIKKLYVGKIGLADLDVFDDLPISPVSSLPTWLQ